MINKDLSAYTSHVNDLLYFMVVESEVSLPKPKTHSSTFQIETVQ